MSPSKPRSSKQQDPIAKKKAVENAGKGRSDDSNQKEKDSVTEEYREGENKGIGNQLENTVNRKRSRETGHEL